MTDNRIDPHRTAAILVGTEEYADKNLQSLPAAWDNVVSLFRFFSQTIGIPQTNISRIFNAEDPRNIIQKLGEVQKREDIDTILFYYSGHGLMDEDMKEYYLSLTNTRLGEELEYSSVSIKSLSRRLGSTDQRIILILDSCFSANAFNSFSSKNFLILASSKADEVSRYPVGEENSAFTRALLQVLYSGIEGGPVHLSFRHIFENLTETLKRQGCPLPQIADQHNVSSIVFMENPNQKERPNVFADDEALLEKLYDALYQENNSLVYKREEIAGDINFIFKLKELILGTYPFFISYHLKNMLPDQDFVNLNYLKQYYRHLIQFLSLIAIADVAKDQTRKGTDIAKIQVRLPFASHEFYLDCLKTIAKSQANKLFVKEISKGAHTEADSLGGAVSNMEMLLAVCQNKEEFKKGLIDFICKLAFLGNYHFVSTRQIFANKGLAKYQLFRHQVSSLHGEIPQSYQVKLDFSDTFLYNSAVLLFKADGIDKITENTPYISLWPLVIDANSFEVKGDKPEIYYYVKQNTAQEFLYSAAHTGEVKAEQPYFHFHKNLSRETLNSFFTDFIARLK